MGRRCNRAETRRKWPVFCSGDVYWRKLYRVCKVGFRGKVCIIRN